MIEIAPSILSADFARLGEQIESAERGGAALIHVGGVGGHFVPDLTGGLPVARSLGRATQLPLDAHLMISEPGLYAEKFVEAGAQMVSVHIEADAHIHRTLTAIRKRGAKAGIVVNPATSLQHVEEAIQFADYVLIMSVNPGFGGQEFISTSVGKVRRLRRMIEERGLQTRIEIDGGIDRDNIVSVVTAGGGIIVLWERGFWARQPWEGGYWVREGQVSLGW